MNSMTTGSNIESTRDGDNQEKRDGFRLGEMINMGHGCAHLFDLKYSHDGTGDHVYVIIKP